MGSDAGMARVLVCVNVGREIFAKSEPRGCVIGLAEYILSKLKRVNIYRLQKLQGRKC